MWYMEITAMSLLWKLWWLREGLFSEKPQGWSKRSAEIKQWNFSSTVGEGEQQSCKNHQPPKQHLQAEASTDTSKTEFHKHTQTHAYTFWVQYVWTKIYQCILYSENSVLKILACVSVMFKITIIKSVNQHCYRKCVGFIVHDVQCGYLLCIYLFCEMYLHSTKI